MSSFHEMISGKSLVEAPVVFKSDERKTGRGGRFSRALSRRWHPRIRAMVTEANLTLTEMVRIGLDIRTASRLPLILDGACGWGDPMHLHRTINMVEAAGFAGIEIEDQLLPKRAHHHIGIEHLIPMELMAAKIRGAVRARRDPKFVIIGRTNGSSLGKYRDLRFGGPKLIVRRVQICSLRQRLKPINSASWATTCRRH